MPAAPAQPPQTALGFVSLNPNTFTAGGLIDDIDVEITDALAVEWDYNGQAPLGPALAIEFTDVNGVAHIQYYSAGKLEDWRAHESGEGFMAQSGKTGFNGSSNIAKFIDSLLKAGFPEALMNSGNVKVYVGLKCHVQQTAAERKGLIRTGKNADRPSTTLLVTKIHSLPGSVGGGASQSPVASAQVRPNGQAAGQATAGTEDVDSTIVQALLEALVEPDTVISKKDLNKVVFQYYTKQGITDRVRNQAVVRSGNQEFLKSLAEVGIAYDGATIQMAAEGAVQ